MPLRVQVRVPASTSNLGPGFDCLGLALNLHNTVTLTRRDDAPAPGGMMAETASAFFQRAAGGKVKPFAFDATIEGDVPVSRGLGSSVTVRLGVLTALAELVRDEFEVTPEQLLHLLIELEGHPDNAVASSLGGFVACAPASLEGTFTYSRATVDPQLAFVALIPELKLSTETARGVLPKEIPLRLAVENAQRTARITAAFLARDYPALRGLFVDHFHQPYRRALIPGFDAILEAGTDAGALGSFLSGAGSTLMAVTLERTEEISAAMLAAAERSGLPARVAVLRADNDGAAVIARD
jgi:homoserine kinase